MLPSAPHRSRRATHALSRAVEQNDLARASKALQRKADANALVRVNFGSGAGTLPAPCLFLALQRKNEAMIRLLLDERASMDARVAPAAGVDTPEVGRGYTVLDVVQRPEDLMSLLCAGLLWHQPNGTKQRDMVLHVAAARGWAEPIIWIGRKQGMMDVRNALGQTPMHAAVRASVLVSERWRRHTAVLELAKAGALVDGKDAMGRTPVQLALRECQDLLPALIHAGASLDGLTRMDAFLLQKLPEALRKRLDVAVALRSWRQQRKMADATQAAA